jgi:threonine/homoserine/homoserine lactone efflux protein
MTSLELLWRGGLAGLAISAPVGPVNVLCVSHTISKGKKAGLIAGLGAAAADTIYGGIAGFSINVVIAFLLREAFWIRLFGGILLIAIGAVYYFKKPKPLSEQKREFSHSDFVAAFLLNLTNPTTVLSFLAVLAALHLGGHRPWWMTAFLIGGIFFGAMIWWIFLALMAGRFRDRFTDQSVVWMNRIAGIAIGLFGILAILLGMGHRPR